MSKRRFVGAILIVMALLVMLIPAAEADAETSASAFSIKSGELVKYSGSDTVVTIPDTVTSIGRSAFENNTNVEKIVLSNSVKQIRPYAFWGCDNLKTVTLGKGLTTIGDYAFINCTGLETMTIPANVTSIGIQSFANCQRLEDITIPYQVMDIREDAFDGDYLLNIHCEEGSYADKYAKEFYERQKNMVVYNNTGTTTGTTVQKPSSVPADGVYSGADIEAQENGQSAHVSGGADVEQEEANGVIGSTNVVGNEAYVFFRQMGIPVIGDDSGIASAEVVTGRDRLDQIAAESAYGPQSISSTGDAVVYAEGVIPERAHYRETSYTALSLPEDTREIGRFAYARSGVQQAILAQGIEQIDYAAFYHCDNLSTVELPDSVKSVEAKAFAHTPWVDAFLTGDTGVSDSDFLVSGGVLVAYRGTKGQVTVPEGVRVIAGEAFADHKEIKAITLPTTLEAINDRAFAGCTLMDVSYQGDLLSEDLVEETVSMQTMSRGPAAEAGKRSPYLFWIAAGILLVGGCICIFKEKY